MRFLMTLSTVSALSAAVMVAASAPSQQTKPLGRAQRAYDKLLAGKTVGSEETCFNTQQSHPRLSAYGTKLIYWVSPKLVYVTETSGGCEGVSFGDTLITYPFKARLCHGDIAHTIGVPSGKPSGSCTIGNFVPYRSK
jgi:hypothetical protein